MANKDRPRGFEPVSHLNGNPWNGKVRIYSHSASDGTAIFKGDIVQPDETNTETSGKYPSVKQTVAAQVDNVGAAIGFGQTSALNARTDNLSAVNYCPASTFMYVAVVDDPDVIYLVQEDSDTTTLAATDIWGNADIVVGSGSTTTGLSAMEIDSDTNATTAATLRLLRLDNKEDNAIGANADWLVLIVEHAFRTIAGT